MMGGTLYPDWHRESLHHLACSLAHQAFRREPSSTIPPPPRRGGLLRQRPLRHHEQRRVGDLAEPGPVPGIVSPSKRSPSTEVASANPFDFQLSG